MLTTWKPSIIGKGRITPLGETLFNCLFLSLNTGPIYASHYFPSTPVILFTPTDRTAAILKTLPHTNNTS